MSEEKAREKAIYDASKLTEDEFLSSITGKPVPTVDADGKQIPKLDGLLFKPIDAEDSVAISELCAKHRKEDEKEYGYAYTLARSLIRPDGTRVISDANAPKITQALGGIVQDSLIVIRRISGKQDLEEDDGDGQKKTSSTVKVT